MASHPKTRALALTQNARLKELLMLFDCRDEIASFDVEAFSTKRACNATPTLPHRRPITSKSIKISSLRASVERDEWRSANRHRTVVVFGQHVPHRDATAWLG